MLALPIFPASHPASIVGGSELNFCVRYGNRWTLTPINTNYIYVNSETLKTLAPRTLHKKCGDPYRIRTDVNGVRGHCLNHLTNGPRALYKSANALYTMVRLRGLEPRTDRL